MTNVVDLVPRLSARNPRGRLLAGVDLLVSECEELLVLGRYYGKSTVPELEQALAALMAVRAKLVGVERSVAGT